MTVWISHNQINTMECTGNCIINCMANGKVFKTEFDYSSQVICGQAYSVMKA